MISLRKNHKNEKTQETLNKFVFVASANRQGIDLTGSKEYRDYQIVLNMFIGIQAMNTAAVMNAPVIKSEAQSYEDFISVLYEGSM